MNKKVKKLWVKALTSGEYKQGIGALRSGDRFCCLGVLCDLHSKATSRKWGKASENGSRYMRQGETLPAEVQKWAGLNEDDPMLNGEFLTGLNDDGTRFTKIANLIDKNL